MFSKLQDTPKLSKHMPIILQDSLIQRKDNSLESVEVEANLYKSLTSRNEIEMV